MTTVCFTELASADVTTTKHINLFSPDALYVSTTHALASITGTRESGYNNALYIEPSDPVKKEHRNFPAVAPSTTAALNEDNSQRKKPRKRHPFATGKDDSLYHPNSLTQKLSEIKVPP
ncbi:MAG TPA: hypothetical protein VFL70_01520 [Bacteroidia bacterium]|nr:hypothetical protein [Bacteroidia bacterium]